MKFLCDEMMGALARWLRAAGHDVATPRAGAPDADLAAAAAREGRVLVTRDRQLAARTPGAVLLGEGSVDDDALALAAAVPLYWLEDPFSRCVMDNTPLRPAAPADFPKMPLPARVLPGPHQVCPACGRTYWPGSHVRRMRARLEEWARLSGDRQSPRSLEP